MMKNLFFAVVLGICSVLFSADVNGSEGDAKILDVCIRVESSESFRRTHVDHSDLAKYKLFGIKKDMALPFDNYFRVASVLYRDNLDDHGCVDTMRNMRKNIPTIISKHFGKSVNFEEKNIYFHSMFLRHLLIT